MNTAHRCCNKSYQRGFMAALLLLNGFNILTGSQLRRYMRTQFPEGLDKDVLVDIGHQIQEQPTCQSTKQR